MFLLVQLINIFLLVCGDLRAAPQGLASPECASLLKTPAENAKLIVESFAPILTASLIHRSHANPVYKATLHDESLKLIDDLNGRELAELSYQVQEPHEGRAVPLKITIIKVSEQLRNRGIFKYLLAQAILRHPRVDSIEGAIDLEQLEAFYRSREKLKKEHPSLSEDQLLLATLHEMPSYKVRLALGFGKLLKLVDQGAILLKMGKGAE